MASHVQCVGKKSFTTPSQANAALNAIWRAALRGQRRKKYGVETSMPCRSYRCNTCRKWHLTSLPKKSKEDRLKELMERGENGRKEESSKD